jgi:ethanolamine ammonia-lyase large subunit
MRYKHTLGVQTYEFRDLKEVMAKATPARSGDYLAGVAAASYVERMAARMCLAEVPLTHFLEELLIPYESDEVTRLIIDTHDKQAFVEISHLTVADFRNWLLSDAATTATLTRVASAITPEMAAAVSKLMRNQDLILVAKKCSVITRFRNTIGLPGHLSARLQPNHPTDDPRGIAASLIDGLLYGSGDAVIGINPATDNLSALMELYHLVDGVIQQFEIPTQSCILTHVTNQIQLIEKGAPVDLVFQSIAGTEQANKSFGVDIALLEEARAAALSLNRGTIGDNVMYFETGQGSALSANAHHGVDQQTCEVRAYAIARHLSPLLTNTVVGFIGPEYLYDGKQIIRAGLEDHFCGKLLGVPLGCDVCYTNHAEADQDDMDTLMTLLANAGLTFLMGIPGADDIMLNYQTTSFHDTLYLRKILGLKAAPEFEQWLKKMNIMDAAGQVRPINQQHPLLQQLQHQAAR